MWTPAQAERHLRSLELFGMRFGLDRMRRMLTVLGSPQRRFDTIQVLGTNGKSSTTRMLAAILERHGLRTAAYTSPHLTSYAERVQVGEREIEPEMFAAAIARAAWAAERVNRTLAEDDHVTQFELLTAAALWAMAEREVQVAVVEAGLGGRYDATSAIDAPLTVLTNVGLEHTRWLGPTVTDIAAEKLAVVRPGGTLVLGAGLAEEALSVAQRVAGERGAEIVRVDAELARETPARATAAPATPARATVTPATPARATVTRATAAPATLRSGEVTAGAGPDAERRGAWVGSLLAQGAFQRRNFALARVAAETYLQAAGRDLDERAVRDAAAHTGVPGRLQVVDDDPLTVLDGAHNPDAARALAESLPAIVAGKPTAVVLGVLEDKDAASMLATLLPLCERAWFTAPPSDRALSPAALQSLARQLGFDAVACEPSPDRALADARAWASAHAGAVLATGSVYLVGELLSLLGDAEVARPTRARASARDSAI